MSQPTEQEYKLPPANYPICTRVITRNPFPPDPSPKDGSPASPVQPFLWQQGKDHPFLEPTHSIVRMYVMPGIQVDVYSVPKTAPDGKIKGAVRHTVPWSDVAIIEELLDVATFVEEIEAAETADEPPKQPAAVSAPQNVPATAAA